MNVSQKKKDLLMLQLFIDSVISQNLYHEEIKKNNNNKGQVFVLLLLIPYKNQGYFSDNTL